MCGWRGELTEWTTVLRQVAERYREDDTSSISVCGCGDLALDIIIGKLVRGWKVAYHASGCKGLGILV
jgi:hypothetical protein